MARSSKAALSRQTGDDKEEMIVQNQEIDTPVLPVEHMERLHQFRPDIVDWILKQTENEAADRDKRRQEQERKERRRYFEGIYFDQAGNPCCPACRVPLTCCGISSQSNHRFYGTCLKCQQEIKSNCDAETIFAHARQLKPF